MSAEDMLVTATDGLPARNSGPWAVEKLTNLERYNGIVTTSMKGKFTGGLTFVDLMAGAGRCVDTHTAGRPECAGSTILALDALFPFKRVLAIESHQECVEALRQRVAAHPRSHLCEIIGSDCNAPEVIARVREVTQGSLGIMFVDLLGTEVHMNTLRRITENRKIDMIFTWPEMDLLRNRGMLLEQPARWNDFFGTTGWQQVATAHGPALRLRALQRLYLKQLETFGYSHTKFVESVRNRKGRVLYRPLLASKHHLAVNFWTKASKAPPLRLFDF